jgi:hypothetical protein
MSLDFIKQYVPNLSKEAEGYANETSIERLKSYASTTENTDHIHKLLSHKHPYVRLSAAENTNANKENISKALTDRNWRVRLHAQANPRYKDFFPNGH